MEEWSPSLWGRVPPSTTTTRMIEQAKEELQILEAQHPNRFDYLKLELKSFIHLLESQNFPLPNINSTSNNNLLVFSPNSTSPAAPANSTATTQASSTRRKRKRGGGEMQRGLIREPRTERAADCGEPFNFNGVEVAIEKAQACLRKIQQFKINF